MTPPHGKEAVYEVYGDPKNYIREDGTVRAAWEWHTLEAIELPAPIPLAWDRDRLVQRMRCHHLLKESFLAAFHAIHHLGQWSNLREFGGCYAWRPQRGSDSKLSLHCWGAAVDLNPSTNRLGTMGDMPTAIIQAFEAQGFYWGGRFGRPDPQHFQMATGF